MPLAPHLRLGHAGAAERRVDEQAVGRDAVLDPALLAVEQVGGDDLEVVVGGVGERAAAVAVAHREDARDVGAQLAVDLDVAALVGLDARLVQAEIVGVGPAAGRDQEVRADDLARLAADGHADRHLAAAALDPGRIGIGQDPDALVLEDLADRLRDVLVLARDQLAVALDDRHLAAEAAVHLAELEADVAAAQDHEVLGQEVDRHHRGVVEIGHGRRCPAIGGMAARPPTLMKICSASSSSSPTATSLGAGEAGMADVDGDAVGFSRSPSSTPSFETRTIASLRALTAFMSTRTGPSITTPKSAARRATWAARALAIRRLGRDAAIVDAGAAEALALDRPRPACRPRQAVRERRPGLAGADHDGIEMLRHVLHLLLAFASSFATLR